MEVLDLELNIRLVSVVFGLELVSLELLIR